MHSGSAAQRRESRAAQDRHGRTIFFIILVSPHIKPSVAAGPTIIPHAQWLLLQYLMQTANAAMLLMIQKEEATGTPPSRSAYRGSPLCHVHQMNCAPTVSKSAFEVHQYEYCQYNDVDVTGSVCGCQHTYEIRAPHTHIPPPPPPPPLPRRYRMLIWGGVSLSSPIVPSNIEFQNGDFLRFKVCTRSSFAQVYRRTIRIRYPHI